jgi:hypothetical protein
MCGQKTRRGQYEGNCGGVDHYDNFSPKCFVAWSLQAMQSAIELDREKQSESDSHWGTLLLEPSDCVVKKLLMLSVFQNAKGQSLVNDHLTVISCHLL